MAKGKKGKKGKTISVNMEGVKSFKALPEGEYAVRVSDVQVETSENSGKQYLAWELEVSEGTHEGSKLFHNTSLQPQSLFNLRNLLEAAGMEVPDGAMDLDLNELMNLEFGVTVEHENYQGKDKARIVDVFSLDEESDEGEDEEEDESEDLESMSDDELVEKAKELEVEPVYMGKGKKKKLDRSATISAIEEASEDEDDDESEEDEDEDELTEEELEGLSDEELVEKAKEYEVEVIYSNKKKKKLDRAAIISAILEAAEEDDEDEDDEPSEEELQAMTDEELIAAAEVAGATPVYKGKGKKKKLDREATIELILESSEDEDDDL